MTLNKINKNSAFKIPKDYFETFDVAFFNELELKNQVKQTGYKTPEDFLPGSSANNIFSKAQQYVTLGQQHQPLTAQRRRHNAGQGVYSRCR